MTDVTNNVVTNFVVNNKGASALSALSSSATRVSSLFDRASNIVGTFGSVAAIAGGAMSLTHIVKGTQEYLEQIKKVQDYTKMSAESAGGLMDAMGSVGISGQEGTRALMMMSKAGARAEMSGRGMRQGIGGMSKEYKRLGIDMSNPEKAMLRMAVLAKNGNISQAKLGLLTRTQGETSRKLYNLLKLGPEHIKEQVKEYAKLGIATQANIDRQERIRMLGLKIGSTWENIQRIIGVQLLPIVEDLMQRLSTTLEEWLPKAQKFGEELSMWLHEHLGTVKQITKVLLANFMLVKLTGQGMLGWGQKLGGGFLKSAMPAGGAAATATTAAGGMGSIARVLGDRTKNILKPIAVTGGMGAAWGPTGPLARFGTSVAKADRFFTNLPATVGKGAAGGIAKADEFFTTLPKKIGPAFRSMGSAVPGMFRFAATALRLVGGAAVLAVVVATILKAVQLIRDNVDGIGTYVSEVFSKITARFAVIADMFETTFGEGSALGDFFHKFVFGVVMVFADVLDAQVHLLQTIMETIRFIVKFPMAAIKEGLPQVFARAWDYTEKQTQEKQRVREIQHAVKLGEERKRRTQEATAARETAPNYDFRNSRFDVTQHFAEGFDPDRIALAFSSDLAALGERKLQSGFSPLYAVR